MKTYSVVLFGTVTFLGLFVSEKKIILNNDSIEGGSNSSHI
jgi:hypothetical protein